MESAVKREPTQARSHERRERILRATAELLSEIDYAAVNVATIAGRAETSDGSIYHFVPNKDAIIHALAGTYLDDMRDSMQRAFSSRGLPVPQQVIA